MPTLNAMPAPQAPMNKLEAAIAGYLNQLALKVDARNPIYRMNFYSSQSTAKKSLPACIVWCEEANEVKAGSRVYQGRWFVYPWTQKDDDNNPAATAPLGSLPGQTPVPTEVLHDCRLSAIQEGLRDPSAVTVVINYPGTGNRPVASFHLFGFKEAEDKHADRQRAFGEALCYEGGFAGYSVR